MLDLRDQKWVPVVHSLNCGTGQWHHAGLLKTAFDKYVILYLLCVSIVLLCCSIYLLPTHFHYTATSIPHTLYWELSILEHILCVRASPICDSTIPHTFFAQIDYINKQVKNKHTVCPSDIVSPPTADLIILLHAAAHRLSIQTWGSTCTIRSYLASNPHIMTTEPSPELQCSCKIWRLGNVA